MEEKNYLTEEFKRIFSKKSVLISVIAVLLVPLIYAMIMLSPKWGPQDNIDNISVAVVNNDQGANQDGTVINVGDELVENLKENPTLGWDFVSSEEASKGMDDMKYYMTIEVPKEFSQKVITVMDENPERPELKFTQNEGLHYMAAQVTDRAKDTIKEELSSKITQTYVENVVDQLGEVGDGFTEAADGADQINDGSNQLKDGSNEILSSLIGKTDDIGRLADGAIELNAGTHELLTNLNDKSPDISRLADGANELSAGAGELKAGTGELKSGANDLKAGTGELKSGANELKSGTSELKSGANDLKAGAGQLQAGTKDLKAGTGELKAGSSQLKAGSSELSQGTKDLKAGTTELKNGADEASAGSDELLAALDVEKGRVGAGITELAAGTKQARSGVKESIESLKLLQMLLENLANTPEHDDAYDDLIDGINGITNILASSIEEAEQEKIPDLDRLVAGGEELRAGLADEDGEFKSGLIRLNNGLGELSTGAHELDSGATQLANGAKELKAGAAELDAGAKELNVGAGQLNAGAGELNAGVGQLNAGANELNAGAGQLNAGASELNAGAGQLNTGANQLDAGASELSAGAVQVADGNQTVKAGWADLQDGASQLHDGSTQIRDGNATVKTGWFDLTDGVSQVDEGLLQLVDGSSELHEGLQGGAEQVGELDPQEDNIVMFAEPVVLDGEVINSFPFYRDANAPYIITLALFVGILAMSFVVPYRKPAILPASAVSWYAGKFTKLASLAIAQALIISLYSLFILKIEVHSGIQFVLFSVWVSLTFLMIVLFLVVLAGNIGRFAALAFAVIQLSTTGSDLPIHMLPEGLRNLSVFLPFTYSIDGFKNIITLGSTSSVWANIGVLFIYFATFALLSGIVFFIRYRRLNREELSEEDGTETAI